MAKGGVTVLGSAWRCYHGPLCSLLTKAGVVVQVNAWGVIIDRSVIYWPRLVLLFKVIPGDLPWTTVFSTIILNCYLSKTPFLSATSSVSSVPLKKKQN